MSKKLDIKEVFIEAPEREFHIREIAKKLKINPMTSRKYLLELQKEEFILGIPSKLKIKNYQLNIDNPLVKEEKKHNIVKKIIMSGFVNYLKKELNHPAIILFGSAAKAEDTSKSDLDIFVYSETKKEVKLDSYKKKLGRNIQLFLMSEKELENNKKKNKHLINNIINGILISGFIEVFK